MEALFFSYEPLFDVFFEPFYEVKKMTILYLVY